MKYTASLFVLVSIAVSANGQFGFDVNTPYRIQSQSGGTVLDLSNWITTNGNTINNLAANGASAQQWQLTAERFGYRIATVVMYGNPPPCLPVITKNPNGSDVYINCFYDGRNQQWEILFVGTSPTNTNQNVFAIRNSQTNCILQNNGVGQRVTCAVYDPNNILLSQRWDFLP